MEYKIGMELEGTVTGVQTYGAFVSLDKNTQGLIHISEVKHGFIKNIGDVLTTGDKIKVKIIDIDDYSKKISLSMRALEPYASQNQAKYKKYFTNKRKKIGFQSIEEMLPNWINENMKELTGK